MKTKITIILSVFILAIITIVECVQHKQNITNKEESPKIITENDDMNEVKQEANEKTENNIENVEEGFTEKELEDMEYVDTSIQQLIKTESFKQASLNDRAVLVLSLLENLEDDGYIKNIYYENGDTVISFEYNCDVFGGVMIKEWDSMMN